MQRRQFLQSSIIAASAISTGMESTNNDQKEAKEFYEWREYDMHFGSDQAQLENYFKTALIPAYNKYGIKAIGVFKELSKSEPAKIYLLIPYASIDNYTSVNAKVKADEDYLKNSQAYTAISADKAVYSRFNSWFMIAFDGMPKLIVPDSGPRIFELRTYEGYSEDAVRRKIKMFNDGEFPIFYRTKLTPVFFGEVISGKNLPRLTYMITFKNLEERDKNWAAFGADPDWKRLLADPQYANTVSNIIKIFLEPTVYSQV
ncbi:MAG: NIPSNAP family protein [Bacteroidetes bacterium]|nr:NIPSNAP family protein [Bacteroidota bacterium]MBS1608707.1 NIPSNAP family protein [Bacteroidota bacterium]